MATPSFDFESIKKYSFVFTAQDYLYTSDNKTLTVTITDVNEAPAFTVTAYSVEIQEELVSFHAIDSLVQQRLQRLLGNL